MLQDRIKAISPYFIGIESYNEALIIRVRYPENWGAYDANDGSVKVAKSEDAVSEYYYYGNSNEIDLDRIFDLIEETIQMNQSVLLKVELLKVKIKELKELFDTKSLEELNTLEFVTTTPKTTKVKKKSIRKTKVSQEQNKQPSEAPQTEESQVVVEEVTVSKES